MRRLSGAFFTLWLAFCGSVFADGTVRVSCSRGTLSVVGDDARNSIAIAEDDRFYYVFTTDSNFIGPTAVVPGNSLVRPVNPNKVRIAKRSVTNVNVSLRGGADAFVNLNSDGGSSSRFVNLRGNLTIDLGPVEPAPVVDGFFLGGQVELQGVTIGGATVINMPTAADYPNFYQQDGYVRLSASNFGGSVSVTTTGGGDVLDLNGSQYGGGVAVSTGGNQDAVTVTGSFFADDAAFDGGESPTDSFSFDENFPPTFLGTLSVTGFEFVSGNSQSAEGP